MTSDERKCAEWILLSGDAPSAIRLSALNALTPAADPALFGEVLRVFHRENSKLQAIKVYRARTGVDLREAKEAVEKLIAAY